MKFILKVSAAMLFAMASGPVLMAQSARDRDTERAENERDLDRRSMHLRLLSIQAGRAKNRRPPPAQALDQLQKDFSQLQVVNRSLLRVALGGGTLDPRFVSKSVSEIRKRGETQYQPGAARS